MNGNFFATLFDMSFSEFITPRIISLIYIVGVVLAGIGLIFTIIAGFAGNVLAGFLLLLVAPVIFIIYVVMLRVYLELVVVFFKMYGGIRALQSTGVGAAATPPPGGTNKLDVDI